MWLGNSEMLCSVDVTTAVCRRQYGKMLNLWVSCQAWPTPSWGLLEQVTASPRAQQHLTPVRRSGLLMRTQSRETHPEFVVLGLWTVVTVDLECLVDSSDYL